jgi:hypothetical protein
MTRDLAAANPWSYFTAKKFLSHKEVAAGRSITEFDFLSSLIERTCAHIC